MTTNTQSNIQPYHRPEPKLFGLAFYSLLIPATIWVIGIIVYGAESLKAADLDWEYQGLGSALMVIGGEIGTLTTAWQIFRKHKGQADTVWDWVCLIISLIATEGILFVIFTRQTAIDASWVTKTQIYGPLALLLFSGLDFYANVHELGVHNQSFDLSWEKWNEGQYKDRLRQERKLSTVVKADSQPVLPSDILDHLGPVPHNVTATEVFDFLADLGILPVGVTPEMLVDSQSGNNDQVDNHDSQSDTGPDVTDYFPPPDGTTPDTYLKSLSPGKRRDLLLDICRKQPSTTQSKLAEHFGVSRTTIVNDMKHLTSKGLLRRNGHGVEVLVQ